MQTDACLSPLQSTSWEWSYLRVGLRCQSLLLLVVLQCLERLICHYYGDAYYCKQFLSKPRNWKGQTVLPLMSPGRHHAWSIIFPFSSSKKDLGGGRHLQLQSAETKIRIFASGMLEPFRQPLSAGQSWQPRTISFAQSTTRHVLWPSASINKRWVRPPKGRPWKDLYYVSSYNGFGE